MRDNHLIAYASAMAMLPPNAHSPAFKTPNSLAAGRALIHSTPPKGSGLRVPQILTAPFPEILAALS